MATYQPADDELYIRECSYVGSINSTYLVLDNVNSNPSMPSALRSASGATAIGFFDKMVIDIYRNSVKVATVDTSTVGTLTTRCRISTGGARRSDLKYRFTIVWSGSTRPAGLPLISRFSPTSGPGASSTTAYYIRLVSGGIGTPPFPTIASPTHLVKPSVDDVFYLKKLNASDKVYEFKAITSGYNWNLGSATSVDKSSVESLSIDVYRRATGTDHLDKVASRLLAEVSRSATLAR